MSMQISQLILNKITIQTRESDNFINATELCKAGGKQFNDWYKLDGTKEFIRVLAETLKQEMGDTIIFASENQSLDYKVESQEVILVDIKKGNSSKFAQGSWIHPDLAVYLAQWISPTFAIQVARWVRELMVTGHVSIESQKTNQELIELTNQLKIKDELLIEAMANNLKLDNKILNIKTYNDDGWIYLITNDEWQLNNCYRLGKTTNLNNRFNKYKIGRRIHEKLYYVYYFRTKHVDLLETLLRHNLENYRENPKTDEYILHADILIPLVDKISNIFNNQIMNLVNNSIIENEKISKEPVKLEELVFSQNDVMEIADIDHINTNTSIVEIEEFNAVYELPVNDKEDVKEEIILSYKEIEALPTKALREKFKRRNEFITKMNKINMKVVSAYNTTEHKIALMCKNEHIFDIIPNNNNLDRVVCHICDNVRKTNDATVLVSNRGMRCLNYNEHKFKCSKGHEFITSNLNYTLHRNGGCPTCNKRARLTKQDHHDVAAANGGKWVETDEVPSSHFPTNWICAKNHPFTCKYQQAYNYWHTQCLECKNINEENMYGKRIIDIIKIYPSARLLTDKVISINDKITFSCSHIKEWSVMARGFMNKHTWKCSLCKNESKSKGKQKEIIDNDNDNDNNVDNDNDNYIEEVVEHKSVYYDQLLEIITKYNAVLISSASTIGNKLTANINIKCPHKQWTTQVRSIIIAKSWNCVHCRTLIKGKAKA